MTQESPQHRRRRIDLRLVLLVIILLIAAFRPEVAQWFRGPAPDASGLPAENTAAQPAEQSEASPTAPAAADTAPADSPLSGSGDSADDATPGELTEIRPDVFESTAGLIYGRGSRDGKRLNHILRHAEDDLSKPVHGVFQGDQTDILRWIDLAYLKSKQRSGDVRQREQQGRIAITVNLRKTIGYVGGEKGARQNHPDCRYLRLILESDGRTVVTAYPTSSF